MRGAYDAAMERQVFVDHLTLAVRDLRRSRAFYEAALAPLEAKALEVGAEVAFGPPGSEDFTLAEGDPPSGPLHLAFVAAWRREVEQFHAAALEAGGKDNGPPGLRPRYHEGYYAAYVIDPDGHNVEAVFHDR
jgi:catechol 2,3-dioxygenase-like lactoylglutathione lyase family enzyme